MFSCKPDDENGDNGGNGSGNGNGQGQGGQEEVVAQNLGGTMSENTTLKDLGLPVDYIIDGELRLDGTSGPVLHVEKEDGITDRPLSPGEMTRLSDMLSNGNLSNETHRSNIGFYLPTLLAQSNLGQLYSAEWSRTLQNEMSAGRGQTI